MSDKEKTLKDKVDEARTRLNSIPVDVPVRVSPILEALTALEERVEELERERGVFHKPPIKEALEGYLEFLGNLPEADEGPQLPGALSHLKKALEYFKEARDAGE